MISTKQLQEYNKQKNICKNTILFHFEIDFVSIVFNVKYIKTKFILR